MSARNDKRRQNEDNAIYSQLLKQEQERGFTDEEIRSMSKPHRKYVSQKNSGAIAKPAGFSDLFPDRIITPADKVAATRIMTEAAIRPVSAQRPESFISSVGGHMEYGPEEVKYVSLLNTEKVRANSVIPVEFGVTERYPNVQALAAVAAQLVTVSSGSWTVNIPMSTWAKVLPKNGGMDAAGMLQCAEMFKLILNNARTWKAMEVISRNAVTGLEAMIFIRKELDNLPQDAYYLVNTRVVVYLLKPFQLESGSWYERMNTDDTPVIPATAYTRIPKASSRCVKDVKREKLPGVYLYNGGYAPALELPPSTGVWKDTLARYQRMMELQMGSKSCTAILAEMRGYSGLTDDFGKRIQFLLAATLCAWKKGYAVDIALHTVGDLIMLKSSLNRWVIKMRPYLCNEIVDEKGNKKWEQGNVGDVRFILPQATDMSKVVEELKGDCVFVPRPGTVLIVYNNDSMPTSQEKGQAVDYAARAADLIPDLWAKNELIAYMPVYSDMFFSQEEFADQQTNSSMKKSKECKYYVYHFGTASSFKGVVSTLDDIELVGWGIVKKEGKYNLSDKNSSVTVQMPRVKTWVEWQKRVAQDCAIQIVAWLRPVSRYSPISNLPYLSKKGVQIVLNTIESEDGRIIGNYSRIESKQKLGKKAVIPQVEDESEEEKPEVVKPPAVIKSAPVRKASLTKTENRRRIVEEVSVEEEDPDGEAEENDEEEDYEGDQGAEEVPDEGTL